MTVLFKGHHYEPVPFSSHSGYLIVQDALRKGVMNHQGSLREQIAPNASVPQVYASEGLLVAASVSCNSQWIDLIWRLERK